MREGGTIQGRLERKGKMVRQRVRLAGKSTTCSIRGRHVAPPPVAPTFEDRCDVALPLSILRNLLVRQQIGRVRSRTEKS